MIRQRIFFFFCNISKGHSCHQATQQPGLVFLKLSALDLLSEISTVLNCDVASLISESAINNDNYIETQLVNEIKQLDSKKRKMALDFIGLIKTW